MITDADREAAEKRMAARLHKSPRALRARYERARGRIVIRLDTGIDIMFPARLAQGLQTGTPEELSTIEISPTGLGLHWPKLDVDLYVPGLLAGRFGTKSWRSNTPATDSADTPGTETGAG